ncbi:hypothetical protein B1756_18960 [Natrarchaeobaculum aegyptiacum]|uniref:Uncharacterized protein n=1 Tax=Natrarchaeobaculum aegyptiacum TaxID=745377 RepID=A0A2Z2HZW2_9EURY|nr:hypothetical protein B1756_18960 [Natrarchaeobaculum aegyptiacum]
MVYRWDCSRCGFTVWTGLEGAIRDAVQSHLLEHDGRALYRDGFRIGWACPHCSESALRHDEDTAVEAFGEHLFSHVEGRVRSGTHVAADLAGSGNVLLASPPNSAGMENALVHFAAPCDVVLLVTSDVAGRLRLLDQRLTSWPDRTIVLTTSDQPLAGVDDVDLSRVPLEIVKLEGGFSLPRLGETISRIIDEHDGPDVRFSVSFEVLSEIVDAFELETVFRFLHLLTRRLETADALGHFYFSPDVRSGPTLNLLGELFDLQLEAESDRFVSTA